MRAFESLGYQIWTIVPGKPFPYKVQQGREDTKKKIGGSTGEVNHKENVANFDIFEKHIRIFKWKER